MEEGGGSDPGAELRAEETERTSSLSSPQNLVEPRKDTKSRQPLRRFCLFVYILLQSADLIPPHRWVFMASQMKGGRKHVRVLCSVPIQIPPGWALQGSILLTLVCFIPLGIIKALPPRHPLPALVSPKKWVILSSERDSSRSGKNPDLGPLQLCGKSLLPQ